MRVLLIFTSNSQQRKQVYFPTCQTSFNKVSTDFLLFIISIIDMTLLNLKCQYSPLVTLTCGKSSLKSRIFYIHFKKRLGLKDPCMKLMSKQNKLFPMSLLSTNLPRPSASAKLNSSYLSKHKAAQ